ncbi:MAG TPA: enoyl-CoA hydratase/isomerase family protein [Candidatus Binataceae bacterium]|jgi:enoyl-CoA hydratase/carnithine racemase|nr:enoyl-CoA hydratase/isomerase family protein [Candidatus Binataceae bacterium]
MPEDFLCEKSGAVTTITFNRPERRNCMNRQVMSELEDLLRGVRDDRDTRVLIVTGKGTAFSAGADMTAAKGISDPKERMRAFAAHNGGVARMVGRTFDHVTRLDCMTIAAVNGHAVGGGWALAAAFDFIIAAEQAEFWVPEVELGAAFTGGPALAMAARLGPWRAKDAMIRCRHFKARELYELGMVNRVVPSAGLMPAARELADELMALPQKAATATKHFIDGIFVGPRLY